MEAPTDLYELTFSCLGPTGNVDPLLDVKVISSLLSSHCNGLYPSDRGYEIISPFTTRTSRALCSPIVTSVHLQYKIAGRRAIASEEGPKPR
jgi:hypothetical protein